jgi:hypothetical protein
MIDLKHLDAELREIEFMVLAVLDAAETIVADPQMASSAATLRRSPCCLKLPFEKGVLAFLFGNAVRLGAVQIMAQNTEAAN